MFVEFRQKTLYQMRTGSYYIAGIHMHLIDNWSINQLCVKKSILGLERYTGLSVFHCAKVVCVAL